jgi:hypothetical protein
LGRYGRLLHPILFAASVPLGVAARGAGQYDVADLALVTAVSMLVVALVLVVMLGVVRLFDRTDRAAPLAAVLAMLAVAWFFFYGPVQSAIEAITWRGSRDRVLLPLGAVATIGLLVWLLRQSRDRLDAVNAFLARFGALLLVVVLLQLVYSQRATPSAVKRSALARQLAQPVQVAGPPPAGRNTPRRDIYVIILDGHPNARASREVLGFDNTAFEDSLRALGFVIPPGLTANYTQSILSIPSLLNASHVTQLAQDAGVGSRSHALPRFLIEYNRTARFLKQQGYKYVLFPSPWWPPTQHSPLADVEFDARPGFSLMDEARLTLLRTAVLNSTLFRYQDRGRIDTLYHVRTSRGLRRMPADTAPTFVLAHFLLPHMPFFLDASCRVLERPIVVERTTPAQRAAYAAQMQCVDRLVLDVVRTLLRDSRPEPVIVLVGDHGSWFSDPKYFEHPERASKAFIRERFAALGAFYLPAGGDSAFTAPVSLVNVMGNVLRYYFNAQLPRNGDEMYVSGEYPYRYYRVDSTGYVNRGGNDLEAVE